MIDPEDELEEDRDDRELHRHDDRVAEDGVVDQIPVVLQPDELRRLEAAEELLVREALVDRPPERIDRDERDDRERRGEHEPRETRLLALEPRRAAASHPRDGGLPSARSRSSHRPEANRRTGAEAPVLLACPSFELSTQALTSLLLHEPTQLLRDRRQHGRSRPVRSGSG